MASDPCEGTEGKYVWPELLGAEGTVAEATIKRENSTVNVEIVVEGTIVPADFRCVADRVQVWVDTDGFVTRVVRGKMWIWPFTQLPMG